MMTPLLKADKSALETTAPVVQPMLLLPTSGCGHCKRTLGYLRLRFLFLGLQGHLLQMPRCLLLVDETDLLLEDAVQDRYSAGIGGVHTEVGQAARAQVLASRVRCV